MSRVDEQDIKDDMNTRQFPDSLEIAFGVPSKGSAIKIKTYYDAMDIDTAQKKIENTLKIRQFLIEKGIIQ